MGFINTTAFLVAVLACAPFLATYLSRQEYEVPPVGSGVVISGASTGIGYHAALHLADAGFTAYAGVRKKADFEAIKALNKPGLVPVYLDVTQQESVDEAYETVTADAAQRGIQIAGLVNNAGVLSVSPLELSAEEETRRVYETNVFGVLRLTQKFLPTLRQVKGRIINISSMAGFLTVPRAAVYSSTKHALEAISDGFRIELAHHGVSVSVVQPGAVKSAIFDKAKQQEEETVPDARYRELYGHLIKDRSPRMIERADGPEVTSEAIHHALVSPFPHVRYVVANLDGTPAWVVKKMIWLLPERLMDKLLLGLL